MNEQKVKKTFIYFAVISFSNLKYLIHFVRINLSETGKFHKMTNFGPSGTKMVQKFPKSKIGFSKVFCLDFVHQYKFRLPQTMRPGTSSDPKLTLFVLMRNPFSMFFDFSLEIKALQAHVGVYCHQTWIMGTLITSPQQPCKISRMKQHVQSQEKAERIENLILFFYGNLMSRINEYKIFRGI